MNKLARLQRCLAARVLLLAATSMAGAQTPAGPTFEVTSVRPNRSGSGGSSSSYRDGRFTASNVLLKNLMQYSAYGVPEMRILGGPKWLNSVRFDIDAKVVSATAEQIDKLPRAEKKLAQQHMFQELLADRFALVVHWETRELPIYSLVPGKSGVHLTPSTKADGGFHTSANDGQFSATGITLPQLAETLTQEIAGELGRVITDGTGLQGRYDLALKWTPDNGGVSGTDQAPGPSIFTALQEQLGLKLEPAKGPVRVLVIDKVEMPSEN